MQWLENRMVLALLSVISLLIGGVDADLTATPSSTPVYRQDTSSELTLTCHYAKDGNFTIIYIPGQTFRKLRFLPLND